MPAPSHAAVMWRQQSLLCVMASDLVSDEDLGRFMEYFVEGSVLDRAVHGVLGGRVGTPRQTLQGGLDEERRRRRARRADELLRDGRVDRDAFRPVESCPSAFRRRPPRAKGVRRAHRTR